MSGLYAGQALGGFGATIASNYTWHTVFHWFGIAGIVYAVFLVFTLFDIERKPRVVVKQAVPTEKSGIMAVAYAGIWHFLFLDTLVLLYGIELSRLGN